MVLLTPKSDQNPALIKTLQSPCNDYKVLHSLASVSPLTFFKTHSRFTLYSPASWPLADHESAFASVSWIPAELALWWLSGLSSALTSAKRPLTALRQPLQTTSISLPSQPLSAPYLFEMHLLIGPLSLSLLLYVSSPCWSVGTLFTVAFPESSTVPGNVIGVQ